MTKNTTTSSNRRFPLFRSHLDLAHSYWSRLLQLGDIAVDATAGNGHDTLFLAQAILTPESGDLYVFDVQKEALEKTKNKIDSTLPQCAHRVHLFHQSHEEFPKELEQLPIKLFVYNLGYLPGAEKTLTTKTATTLNSIKTACRIVAPGGAISITCYPGHDEGALEEAALVRFCEGLNNEEWSVCHHRWLNREKAPSLILLQKNELTTHRLSR